MAEKTIETRLKVRGDTASNWSSVNPTLLKNEIGYDETNKKFKIGDGSTAWNSLSYMESGSDGNVVLEPINVGGGIDGWGEEFSVSDIDVTDENYQKFIKNPYAPILVEDGCAFNVSYFTGEGDEYSCQYSRIYDGYIHYITITWSPNNESTYSSHFILDIQRPKIELDFTFDTAYATGDFNTGSSIFASSYIDLLKSNFIEIIDSDGNRFVLTKRENPIQQEPIYFALTYKQEDEDIVRYLTFIVYDDDSYEYYYAGQEIGSSDGSINLEPINIGGTIAGWFTDFYIDGADITTDTYYQFLQNKTAPIMVEGTVFQLDHYEDYGNGDFYGSYSFRDGMYSYEISIQWSLDNSYLEESTATELRSDMGPIDIIGSVSFEGEFSLRDVYITIANYNHFTSNNSAPLQIGDIVFQLDTLSYVGDDGYRAKYSYIYLNKKCYVTVCWEPKNWHIDEFYEEEISGSGGSSGNEWQQMTGSINFNTEFIGSPMYISVAKNTAEGKYTLTMNSRNDDTGFYVGYYGSNEVYFNDSETREEYEIYMHEETSDAYIYEVKVSSLGEIYDSSGSRVLPISYTDSSVCIVTKSNSGSSSGRANIYNATSAVLDFNNPTVTLTVNDNTGAMNADAIKCSFGVENLGTASVILHKCSHSSDGYIGFTDALMVLQGQRFWVRYPYLNTNTRVLTFTPDA